MTVEQPNVGDNKVEIDELRTVDALENRTKGERYLKFNPEFTLFRNGFGVCLQLLNRLGEVKPEDARDRVLRDLACDALDSLWLAEHAVLSGYDNQALVLLRRTYEAVSLMAYFINFTDAVEKWERGEQIRNSDIREALDSAKIREPKDELATMYKVYSLFSHVNRTTVYQRQLGEANRFTLGCQGNVPDEIVGAVVRELLGQMMWFLDVFNYAFLSVAGQLGGDYGRAALGYRAAVQGMVMKLKSLY